MTSSSSPPLPPPPPAVVDQIIARLETELPTLFEADLSYDIYSQDILFKDPVNRFRGKVNYRIVFWTLRFHGRLFFRDLHFDLHRVYREGPHCIRADWTVRGTLRLPWRPRICFNGVSDYQLSTDGLIYQHIDTWDRPPGEVLRQFFRLPAEQ